MIVHFSKPAAPDWGSGAPARGSQVRGLVHVALRALPANDTLARVDAENLWKDQIQLDSCIASLDDDGLIEILENGALRLPHG